MSEFACGFDALTAGQREQAVRHLEQTYHVNYGHLERTEALMFRLPAGDPATVRTEPPAVFLRELTEAARVGAASVRVAKMSKPDRYRASELLRQTASRPGREAYGDYAAIGAFLGHLVREWDAQHRLTGDELERAEYVRLPRGARVA